MTDVTILADQVNARFAQLIQHTKVACDELTIEVARENLNAVCLALRDEPAFNFKTLIDVCGVDYLHYGYSEWQTESATASGFERGVEKIPPHPTAFIAELKEFRFASVYHLLSLEQNQRIRIKVRLSHDSLNIPSVVGIWPSANWYEREAFDLFGILYTGHPDLRRILTDYGFVGHPFRKDFPLIGNVEARYDGKLQCVVYEPVSIKPRILEPKVIRCDNRYETGEK